MKTHPPHRDLLIDHLPNFLRRSKEIAYVHRRGYRTFRWSYREIAETATRFSRELEHRGIGKGERVVLWGENCAEWVAAFFGCLLCGVVVVPMDEIATAGFAMRVASQVEAKLIVCSPSKESSVEGFPSLLFDDLVEAVAGHSAAPMRAETISPGDPVEIVFTSGTTAEPKGVVISHRNILSNLEPVEIEIEKYRRLERPFHPIRFLNLLPLSHVFGQFMGIFIPQLIGGTVIFHHSLNPAEVLRAIKRERVSVAVTVPRLLETLRDKLERDIELAGRSEWFQRQFRQAEGERFIGHWWRFRKFHRQFGWKFWAFVSGGAVLNAETETFWDRLGFAVIQGYGLTETSSLISVNHPMKLGKGSIGKTLPGYEVRLDSGGEILVRGEAVASGYWQGKALVPVGEDEGWFRTGDIGELDAEGNLYFKGRKKNVIVTPEGLNVYPEDLEAALRHQHEVRDCVVVGIERQGNAEPCAVLLVRSETGDAAAIVQRANETLADFQRIRHWFVWPEEDFPRTATQKPCVREILARVEETQGGRATARAASGSLATLIEQITGRRFAQLTPDASLSKDLSLSSIDRVALLSAVEDRYQVDLNETNFTSATTVGELEQMLRQPAPRAPGYAYPRWAQRWWMRLIRLSVYYLLAWPATVLLGYPRVRGREKLRGVRGPALIISNHVAYLDPGLLMKALPLRFRHRLAVAMVGERLLVMKRPPRERHWFLQLVDRVSYALVVGLFNLFPLPQETGFRESFAFAGESVDRGYSVLVFPEGERTQTGKMAPFQTGIGLLALNLGVPIIPMRIDGLFELKYPRRHYARPGTITITIGSPIEIDRTKTAAEIARKLETLVASL